MSLKHMLFGLAVLFTFFTFNMPLSADEAGQHHGAGEEMLIPNTVPGIWHEIKEHEEELDQIIQSGELSKVHQVAFEIRDLSNALAEKSTELPAAKIANVKSSVERIGEVAGLLDQYGDAGDQEKTQAEFLRLGKLLKFIETQYPESALKSAGDPHHGEGEHKHHH